GPILGGMLLAQFGIASAFWLGVVLYAAGLVAALRMQARVRTSSVRPASFITSIRGGLVWLRDDRRMIGVFSLTVIFKVFAWPFTSMIPVSSTDYLHLGPGGVGLLASCEGIGGLIGALLVAGLARPSWYGRIYVGATTIYLAMVIG